MQASEMNLDQCHAWLRANGVELTSDPLLVMSLDAAAAAMPEGWYWVVNFTGMIVPFLAIAVERVPTRPQIEIRADTELLARFRLAVACRQAQGAANDKWQGAAHEG